MFEVTASWAAEAAACGLWLVGLLKIWSLTFQVRMSHRHWSHNCSCAITQACWEEKTSEQMCCLYSVTVCVSACMHVSLCVRDVPQRMFFFIHIHLLMQHCNHLLKHYNFLFCLSSLNTFEHKLFKNRWIPRRFYTCQVLVWQNVSCSFFILTIKAPDRQGKFYFPILLTRALVDSWIWTTKCLYFVFISEPALVQ